METRRPYVTRNSAMVKTFDEREVGPSASGCGPGSVIDKIGSEVEMDQEVQSALASVKHYPRNDSSDSDKPQGLVLYVCIGSLALCLFLAALDIMIVISLVEEVSRKFNDYSKTGWIFAGYSLPNALFALLWGRLGSVIGFKSCMLFSIVIFEIGSLISGVANSMDMLIGGRVVAGIGGSGLQSLCFVIASQLVNDQKRGIVIACMSSAFAVASIVGPFLGGAFTTHVTWRWCFYVNLPIGGLAFVVFLIFYKPEGKRDLKTSLKSNWDHVKLLLELRRPSTWGNLVRELVFSFDVVEFILFTTGMVLVLLALTFGGNRYRWDSSSIIVMIVIGLCLCILALFYEFWIFPRFGIVKRNPKYCPVLVWKLIKMPGVLMPTFAVFFVSTAFICQVNYVVQFFQLIYHKSAWIASIRLIATMVPTIITVVFSGLVNNKLGFIWPIAILGGIASIVGAGLLTLLDNHSNGSDHIGLLILPGVAFGATIQSSLMCVQLQVDKKDPRAKADFVSVTTLNAFSKNLGTAVGGVISDTVFGVSVNNKLARNKSVDIHGTDELVMYRNQHYDGPRSTLGNIISDSIKNVFYMALGLSALCFVFSVFAPRKNINVSPRGKADEGSKHGDEV